MEVLKTVVEEVYPESKSGRPLRFEPASIQDEMKDVFVNTIRFSGVPPGQILEGMLGQLGLSVDSHKPHEIVIRPTSYWQITGRMVWN